MSEIKILIVDDEENICDMLSRLLVKEGFSVVTAKSHKEAAELIQKNDFTLALLDLFMPEVDGIQTLKALHSSKPDTIGIIMTGYATIDSAVEAMKAGAFDYVSKPFNLDEILLIIKRAIEYQRLRGENLLLKSQLKKKYKFESIVGNSEEMIRIFQIIETIADSDSTVIIYGESGTGKELVAKAIHYNSIRRDKCMVPVNCGAIPEGLLESELFGHVKGAFTGAAYSKIGRFEMASGGTIFLDEIGDMSLNLQVKLLRVLQEREFIPVGGTKNVKVDVRVIAATHRDLEKAVEEKIFREDLFYRLNVIPLIIPPLRERKGDTQLLVRHFLDYYNKERGSNIEDFSPEVMKIFSEYNWPGNVRELENMIERLVIFNRNKKIINVSDLPQKFQNKEEKPSASTFKLPEEGLCINTLLSKIENDLILQALNKTGWVKEKAAKLLNLNRTTLVQKIKKRKLENTAS
ncbi:MAG: Fis family transcriptional regulator [Candidatus Schekmanbacteria bacterium RIFCSPHIGHO2_02_FULL_38_11]|uniref:Fis family transcriptional regulator n=1 Tax=Candidatus Schekmanbacteria bacterium RIFCSPLOWO2_12_FULL_38_15 TaxID=1817883 RepID=A0A1F7SLC0_9BACT|nr:MAG: Fis family transcriptional regulator [Candidatus Schekmanbacteria bacterium GWA2_38_9]OGL47946.1 MAG: Fis family transcriptional regulator [Candidatus Schekmanbacteria bacterium RIFCSPLOWO2_02_FULL_38_14]OGL49037.1 MAG: Fis family transcriptional regulator [Candidatus Schekmanbacteria bacterium RIFCSPHIGHO2_02_FULL_38_11]OGL54569.1 MAG: Fis family transcriptional regulator [Candidatus Schekmanbacteria bacterium RIFCSPLOWO2_12_FULL_38_15]